MAVSFVQVSGEVMVTYSAAQLKYTIRPVSQALPFGQPPVAKTAQLVFAVGGKADSVKLASKYIVPNIGRKVMEFGEDPSKASAFKLIGNSFILSTVEMVSESMTLAEKAGIGADRVLEWINDFYPGMFLIRRDKASDFLTVWPPCISSIGDQLRQQSGQPQVRG